MCQSIVSDQVLREHFTLYLNRHVGRRHFLFAIIVWSYLRPWLSVIRAEVQTNPFYCHMFRLTPHWVVIVVFNIPAFSLLRLPVICVCEISISFKDLCFPVWPLWISMHLKWSGISNLTRASDIENPYVKKLHNTCCIEFVYLLHLFDSCIFQFYSLLLSAKKSEIY